MNKTILIIEDNTFLLDGLKAVLEIEGYKVVTANNAEDAVKVAFDHDYDLIITDYKLPTVDGITFATWLQSMEKTRYIPVFLITGMLSSQITEVPCSVQIVAKPFDIDDLLSRIASCLYVADKA